MLMTAALLLWQPALHAQALKKVTVALGGDGLQISTIHIANGAGFFKEEGIEIELVDVNSGPRQVAAISGGSALFGPVGMIQAIKANAEGGNVAAIANLFSILDLHVVIRRTRWRSRASCNRCRSTRRSAG
jgi:ABC-type nitrate/sulfonate/bicarbonate transport system substrate-binding protein